jgi:hypothetical protein
MEIVDAVEIEHIKALRVVWVKGIGCSDLSLEEPSGNEKWMINLYALLAA